MFASASGGALAGELSVSGQVYQQLGYSDNIRLSTEDETDSLLSISAASLNLAARTPTLELGLDGEADYYEYIDESDLSTDNQFVRAYLNRTGKRSLLGLEASFRRDSDITSQLDSGGERELDDERRNTFVVSPSLTYLLSPRNSVVSTVRYRDRSFPDGDRIDNFIVSGNVGLQHQATRRTILGGQIFASYFESSRQEALFVSPQIFLGYELADRVDLDVATGPSFVRSDTQQFELVGIGGGVQALRLEDESDSSIGYAVDGTLSLEATATTDLELAFTRLLEPSGDGGEATETTRVEGILRQRLSPHVVARVSGALQRRVGIGDSTAFADRNDAFLTPSLRWSLTEQVVASINYRLRYREFDNGDDAVSNSVFVRLSYDFPDYRTSY